MSREFLPGIDSYGEFRSRLKDAEEAEKILKKGLEPNYLAEEDDNNPEEDIEDENQD